MSLMPPAALSDERSRGWTVALVAGAIGLGLIAILAMMQFKANYDEAILRDATAASVDRQEAVEDYLAVLVDIETGQRGYVVTGNRDFLDPVIDGRRKQPRAEAHLRGDFAGRGAQEERVEKLIEIGRRRIETALKTIDVFEREGRLAAEHRIAEGAGKRLMDEARALADKIDALEDRDARGLLMGAGDRRAVNQAIIIVIETLAFVAILVMTIALLQTVRSLRRAGRNVRDSVRRLDAIFEGGTDAMMMLDPDGNIESMNHSAEILFDRRREDAIGQSNLILFADPPPRAKSQAYLDKLAAGDESVSRSQIFTGIRGDGSTIEAEVVTTPIRLEDGLFFLATARDATERRKIERMKNEFVATVSHELRTPLTSIAGSLGLLGGGAAGALPDKAKRLIDIAHANSERLIRLINDMLDIEKIESGQVALRMRSIALCPTMRTAMAEIDSFAARHQVTISGERCNPEWTVCADPDRLIQIVVNLLSNAVKFSPEGGVVTVHVAEQFDHYRITVSDQGPGIPEEFRARIFSKFAQADATTTRQKGGTGLGLSIVRELAERMGGAVGFESIVGEGTTFWVDLPIPDRHEDEAGQAGGEPGEADAGRRLPLVLHLEDDRDMARVVDSALERFSRVLSVPSLHQARLALARQKFDLAIVDLVMPDGRGTDILPLLGEGEERVPSILFTAVDEKPADGAVDACLVKSKASVDDLCREARKLLGLGEEDA